MCYTQVPLDGTVSTFTSVLATASEPPQNLRLFLQKCKAQRHQGFAVAAECWRGGISTDLSYESLAAQDISDHPS